MDFETLLKQWANEQGFQTWSQDHEAVLRNLASWLNQNAVQQNAHLTFGSPPVFCVCCGGEVTHPVCINCLPSQTQVA